MKHYSLFRYIMEYSFENKKVIVTGAGKGIGRTIAKELIRRNAHVIAISRTQSDLDSLKTENSSVDTHCADISDWEKIERLLETIGPVDFLVNNAGITAVAPILDTTMEQLDSILNINFKAAFHISQVVARQMVSNNIHGSIVNISSIAGKRAFNHHSAYCCSKAALDMLTMTLASELGKFKIRVNSVNPTVVPTGLVKQSHGNEGKSGHVLSMIPLGRFVDEEDVANTVMYLLSDKSAMITGTCIPIDGGQMNKCM